MYGDRSLRLFPGAGLRPPVIHRDIKPENVVLEGGKWGGRIFLVDFGGVQGSSGIGETAPANQWVECWCSLFCRSPAVGILYLCKHENTGKGNTMIGLHPLPLADSQADYCLLVVLGCR
jgi:serine/threonine protein kinase